MPPRPQQSLQLLLQHEQRQTDQALLALRRADEANDRAAAQREQLHGYRNEYEARWSQRLRAGSPVAIVLHYRSFMQRLDQAVAMQSRQAEVTERHAAQARQRLLDCERRVASVRKLLERRGAELAQRSRQLEQKASDEQAQRRRWRATQTDSLRAP
ncbi:MAG TPA: flagellar export protein FliJ [Rubrivivax sp.]|nr:flagellar export protein FliJ [Rubrivivax sp.]